MVEATFTTCLGRVAILVSFVFTVANFHVLLWLIVAVVNYKWEEFATDLAEFQTTNMLCMSLQFKRHCIE